MILKDGSDWQPEDQDLIAWQQNFPDVDVFAELGAMEAWCESNPQKRKTKTGIKRFVTSWLNRARDKGGVSPFAAQASTNNGIHFDFSSGNIESGTFKLYGLKAS